MAGYAEFVSAHIQQPGWVGDVLSFLIDPPPWITFPALVIGLLLIWWDARRSRNRKLSVPTPADPDGDPDLEELMRQWEPTHPYDMPGKLKAIDDAMEFIEGRFYPVVTVALESVRRWEDYIDGDHLDLLAASAKATFEQVCKFDGMIERMRAANRKYDDVSDILTQDHILEYEQSLDDFIKSLSMFRSEADANALKDALSEKRTRLYRATLLTVMWAESVQRTLLLRRRWIVRKANGQPDA